MGLHRRADSARIEDGVDGAVEVGGNLGIDGTGEERIVQTLKENEHGGRSPVAFAVTKDAGLLA